MLSIMPRAPRASVGGICYHVMNRGNGRRAVFRNDGDYQAFLKAIGHACIEIPMPVLGFCLMPNHFHLVVWPKEDGDLSRWMHWVLNTHVRRYHQYYHTSGRLRQDKTARPSYLAAGPVKRPRCWLDWVNQTLKADELEAVRRCVNRGAPFGSADWVEKTAKRLGLQSTLRPRSRPRKSTK